MNTTTHRAAPSADAFEWFDRVRQIVDTGACVEFAPKGLSMWPTLRPATDRVTVGRRGTYRRGDMLLARCDSPRGIFLHRVVAVEPGGYVLMGDANTTQREFVAGRDVAGAVVSISRSGNAKRPSRLATRLFLLPSPWRRCLVSLIKRTYRP